MQQQDTSKRNFNTISPSAKWLLLMKGHTNIPYAKKTAELIEYPKKFIPDFNNTDLSFWGRTAHFENRYYSIDQLLSELPIKNILELSSGYSFRGLDLVHNKDVHYIDTDLPHMIAQKKEFIAALNNSGNKKGKLELLALNAMDEQKFYETVNRFSPGKIVIVNEGLLMYLDKNEKEKLCKTIRNVLKERGGYWITADIYIKMKGKMELSWNEESKKFFEEHNIEENKFESFEEAEAFFKQMGFVVDKEADIDPLTLVSVSYLIKNAKPEQMQKLKEIGKIHTTWRLRLSDI